MRRFGRTGRKLLLSLERICMKLEDLCRCSEGLTYIPIFLSFSYALRAICGSLTTWTFGYVSCSLALIWSGDDGFFGMGS